MLYEAAHVTVDGRDAMLVVHPPNRALVVYRSRDVLLRDLRIDYRPVPYVQGTITKIDNERSTLEFEPHPGHACTPSRATTRSTRMGETKKVSRSIMRTVNSITPILVSAG